MATVLVTGGTGTLGVHLVPLLEANDHQVHLLSRRAGQGRHVGDLVTGEGVRDATRDAEVVIHAASDPPRGKTDLTQTLNLLAHARNAKHLIYISIVGADRIPNPYYKEKLVCERAIAEAGIPHTIARATQFHELVAFGLSKAMRFPVAMLPLGWKLQTVAAGDVAVHLASLADAEPAGRADDFGGPEVLTLKEMAKDFLELRDRPRRLVNLPIPGKISSGYSEGLATCPEHADGKLTWREFLETPSRPRKKPVAA